MDRNTITGIVLIFLIFLGFSLYNNHRTGKFFEAETEYADSLYAAGNYDQARESYIRALNFKPKDQPTINKVMELNNRLGMGTAAPQVQAGTAASDTSSAASAVKPVVVADSNAYGVFTSRVSGEDSFYTLENDLMVMKVSARGGKAYSVMLKNYTTHDGRPVVLFDGDSTVFGFKFFTVDNKPIRTDELYFVPVSYNGTITATSGPASLTMRLVAANGAYIDYIYTMLPGEYMVNFESRFNGLAPVIPANTTSLALDWKMYVPQQEKGRQNEDMYTGLKHKVYQEGVEDLGGVRMQRQKKDVVSESLMRTDWIAYKDQFFSSVVIAEDFFINAAVSSTNADPTSRYLRFFESEIGVPYTHGDSSVVNMKFYFGPNSFTLMKKYDMQLEELVFLGRNIIRGINQFVIIPIFNVLDNFIVSYGLIILILTLLIKAVLFPLTHKSFISQAKMRVMKPMVDELAKKYPKQEDAMKKQQATMELYKKAGVSPMGGCLPMLLQMPILFAMFRFFPTSIELRQQGFLWAKDLSTYDSILDLPFTIPMYGDHVSLFTLLMTASTLISTKITNPAGGQEQMPGMKTMMYLMPVMFMLILNNFSAGLTYYYFLANVITIIQTQVSRRFVSENEILKKIEENRKKPVKKSKWQLRLEEASKRGGRPLPKK
ncbi:MAG: membrane protein insertase YidC [Bacteroidales bacterium]|jgi:YidC/Oxa1 family membrane protein insertase|nr:membrane protein insertase YidC [Bacteroidales bacterium]